MAHRLPAVRSRLEDLEVGGIFVTSLPDIRWACGFTGTNGVLIVGRTEAHFVTDGRYTDQAHAEVDGPCVHVAEDGLSACIEEHGLVEPYDVVAFQADHLTVARRHSLEENHPDVAWEPVDKVFTRLVAKKEEAEVQAIRESQRITERVYQHVVEEIEPGLTEREVAAEITYCHLKAGADKMSFDPIVASGLNAARPHARPTERTLQAGDVVVLDMGCFRNGYASDMTRTIALGDPGEQASQAYQTVRRAQEKALDVAKAGMTGKELDKVARDVIGDDGLEEYFSHGLGHGIGLQVHEWPRVSRRGDDELPEGVCVTIEPGIYVPEAEFGIRIEDIISLRPDGSENLTRAPKDFRIA